MRRLLSVATSMLIAFSATACAGNTTRNNRQGSQNIGYNQGVNPSAGNRAGAGNLTNDIVGRGANGIGTTGRTTGTPGTNLGTRQYMDGTFTGEGNRTTAGNERATVTIRGGRIVDIILSRVDTQGRIISSGTAAGTRAGTIAGGTTSGTTGYSAGLIDSTINGPVDYNNDINRRTTGTGTTGNNMGFGTGTTGNVVGYGPGPIGSVPGGTGGTAMGSPAGTGGSLGGVTGGGTGITGYTGGPTGYTGGTTPGTTMSGTTGRLAGTALDLDGIRGRLRAAMINAQSPNVTIPTATTTTMTSANRQTVDNWKLAVSRALAQATRR